MNERSEILQGIWSQMDRYLRIGGKGCNQGDKQAEKS